MRFVWTTALKDLWRHRRDPLGLVLWIGLPLVIAALVSLAAGGSGGVQPRAHLLVADRDDSFVSGLLVGALSQDRMGQFIMTEPVPEEEGRRRMDGGDATALLVIPDGFGRAVLREEPTTLDLVTNPSERILPGIVEETMSIVADAVFYLHRLIGDEVRALVEEPPPGMERVPDEVIGSLSVRMRRIGERVGDYLSPLAIRLETAVVDEDGEGARAAASADTSTTAASDRPRPSLALSFLPGILFMSLLFMAQGLSEDLWRERDQGTLRRIAVSPRGARTFLLGKVVAGAMIMAGVSVIALGIGCVYFDLAWAVLPAAIAWATFSGIVLLTIMMLIQLHARSQRGGAVVTMAIIFPLMMVGGSFFPFEIMPEWMAAIGKYTPNGWALEELKRILLQRAEPAAVAGAFAALVAMAMVLFVVSERRLRRGFLGV